MITTSCVGIWMYIIYPVNVLEKTFYGSYSELVLELLLILFHHDFLFS